MTMNPANRYRISTSRGFSLLEIMVTLAVIGVLVAVGAPNLTDFMRNQRLASSMSDLNSDLQLARSDSIRRNARVLVCPRSTTTSTTCATTVTTTTWTNGWLVCHDTDNDGACDATSATDPNPMRVRSAPASPLALTGPAATVIFLPTGSANAAATFTMTGGTTTTRGIVLSPSGSLRTTKT